MFGYLAVPAHALITALASLLHAPIVIAIVLTTILVRLLLVPLGIDQHRAQLRSKQRSAGLSERVKRLQKRFRGNEDRLQTELTALYRAEAPGLARHTARGFLPVLAQMPVFMALYAAFTAPAIAGKANILLQETILGVPLGLRLTAATGPQLTVFAAALALAAAICFLSSRLAAVAGWMKLIHYTPVLSVAFLPLAASVYLVTSMAWTVAQTAVLRQWLG